MNKIFAPLIVFLLTTIVPSASAADYAALKARAEKLYVEKSYSRANQVYAALAVDDIPVEEARWVQFRLADTQWRSEASTQKADNTKLDQARQALLVMVRDVQREEEKDRVWVEIQESLGDFHWLNQRRRNWGQGWQYYQQALNWWAGARAVDLARARYLGIIWKSANPGDNNRNYYYGYYGNQLPLPVAQNVVKIAVTKEDQAHAHYLLAMALRNQGGTWEQRAMIPDEFAAALKLGRKTDWYDDALYQYAQWMESQGRIIPLDNGGWRNEPDYPKALEIYRRLLKEFKEGETRYYRQAQNQIRSITAVQLNVSVSHIFVPGSEIQYHLNWRNLKRVDLKLFPVDLTRAVDFRKLDANNRQWLQSIDLSQPEELASWTFDTEDKGDHRPGAKLLRLEQKLQPGAYVLQAKGGNLERREIVLVTDASLVLKTAGKQALVYFCDANDGAPIANATVRVWQQYRDNRRYISQSFDAKTDADGLAKITLGVDERHSVELFAAAISKDRQAFSLGRSYYSRQGHQNWKIYAYTDRPAYRPEEKVEWKLVARTYDGREYHTPSGQVVEFQINDPRGTKVHEGKASLNEFGTAWSSLELTKTTPLGEYRVTFWDQGRKNPIGSAVLFRLEEYKLPEFRVSVNTPEVDGRKKAFRMGEQVEVTVQADYYFGGPVANADVEVIVYQKNYWQHWPQPREFPWFYEDIDQNQNRNYRGNRGSQIKRETLKTDATGAAKLTFDTPQGTGQDFEYVIEARVTDASRREIRGSGSVKVSQQRYRVNLRPTHNLHRPGDKVTVEVKSRDANNQPYPAEGLMRVTRDFWWEIWLRPDGREVKGDELKALKSDGVFPPPVQPGQRPWRLKFRGYQQDEILTRTIKTDQEGNAELTFSPEREGYYRVAWKSEDVVREKPRLTQPITANTTVWVATGKTVELGYNHGGVQIIVDKDTFRVGQKAPVMISVPTNQRYVLFSVEADDLHSYQLVRLSGTVKLVEIDIAEQHVPNVFLSATMVADRQIHMDTKQVIVPPTKNFLTVTIEPDKEQYQARESGTLRVTTVDHNGKPVPAEVSLGLVDESVFYIQDDYAGDPRKHFFGTKRALRIQNQSTFNQKSYMKLIWDEENKRVLDERSYEHLLEQRRAGVGQYDLEDMQADKSGMPGGMGGRQRDAYAAAAAAESAPRALASAVAATAMPMSAPAEQQMSARKMSRSKDDAGGPGAGEPAVVVRTDFRSTVLWQPEVVTDKNGQATVKVKYPDSLTGWKATARVVSKGNQFGIAETTTRTKQPLIVRLQAPRFFVVGDEVTVSAVINNNTDKAMPVRGAIEVDGLKQISVTVKDQFPVSSFIPEPMVPANGESRIDWTYKVERAGPIRIKVTGRGSRPTKPKGQEFEFFSDGMEKAYVAHEHGIEKFVTKAGKVRGKNIRIALDIPVARKKESTSLTVQITPSLAVTMLDALPYLIDYPYSCTEQTMSRFLPAVITAKTMKDMGLAPEDVMGRLFGGIEPAAAGVAPGLKKKNDLAELDKMVKAGLDRLYGFQHGDGGWGWWKEGDSDHWMTAYVVWGMSLAKQAGVAIKDDSLRRGAAFLDKRLVEEETRPDMQAWMLHALAVFKSVERGGMSKFETSAFDNLWKQRDQLNAYTRALFALAAHHFNKKQQATTLVRNLENGVKIDNRPDVSVLVEGAPKNAGVMGTAHWGEDGVYWRWSDGGVEATAFALRALLTISPKNKLIEPVTNWLVKNRRGAHWSNTRDTAIVVLAMNDYLRVSGELKPDFEYELLVNGKSIAKKKVEGADVFNAPSRFTIDPALIRDGANDIRIRKQGDGPVYFAVETKYFSLEEPIPAAGNEIFVKREYYKLVGRPTLLKGYVYDKVPLKDGETVKSGERVETVLTIEAKNNYEYLLFEDLKPAGFEAVQIRSGESMYAKELKSGAVDRKFSGGGNQSSVNIGQKQVPVARGPQRIRRVLPNARVAAAAPAQLIIAPPPIPGRDRTDYTGRNRWVYQELRDRKVAMFLDKLPEGVWEIRYDLRAEVPGKFHALPVLGHAMYVPEIRCNGAELRLKVVD